MLVYSDLDDPSLWDCCMTELWSEPGSIECKIILDADNKKKALEVVIVLLSKTRRIIAIPNLDLVCFCKENEPISFDGVSQNFVEALAATIRIAETVADDCRERWDVTANLAEANDIRLYKLTGYMVEFIPF